MRTFWRTAFAILGWALVASDLESAAMQKAKGIPAETANACNFQSSFMTWDLPPQAKPRPGSRHNIPLGNKARIQLDALIDVIDETTGKAERFVLIAPCRSEWVYAKRNLFQTPGGEYRCIFSLAEERSLGRGLTADGEPARGHPVKDVFRSLTIQVRTFPRSRELRTPAEINAATESGLQLVGRTEVRDPKRKERYLLEYPIKTMNFRPESASFQVDTGPLLVPDLGSSAAPVIDRLELAHVAYNRLDRAEFILRRPTPVMDKSGRELFRVPHYSEVKEYRVRTQVLTGESR
jgi:hypothetical protein